MGMPRESGTGKACAGSSCTAQDMLAISCNWCEAVMFTAALIPGRGSKEAEEEEAENFKGVCFGKPLGIQ